MDSVFRVFLKLVEDIEKNRESNDLHKIIYFSVLKIKVIPIVDLKKNGNHLILKKVFDTPICQ